MLWFGRKISVRIIWCLLVDLGMVKELGARQRDMAPSREVGYAKIT